MNPAMPSDAKPKLTPKLRFPYFRKEQGWQEKALMEICTINPASEALPESFFYIDLESVVAGKLTAKKRISRVGAPSRAQRVLKKGDVIYQIVRPYQKNNYFFDFDRNDDYVASTGYAQLRAHKCEQFLYQIIHTDAFVGQVIANCTGSSYPAINSSDLAEINLPIPDNVQEQQKIAECLGTLDELMGAESQKLDALKAHKKGLMQQLFPRAGETLPRLRFPEFQNAPEWVDEPLGELGEIITGKTPSTKEPDLWGGDILFITPTDISEDDKYQHTTARTVVETKSTKVLPAGSIVYTCIASIGKMALTVHPSVTNQQINAVVPNEKTLGEFVYYALLNLTPWIKTIPASSTLAIINKTEFSKIGILRPEDKEEQQRIADCLSALDELIAAQSAKLTALQTHKQGLMQQLFPSPSEAAA